MNRPLRIVGSIGPTNQIIITTVHNILVIEWQKAFVQSKGIWLPSQLRSKSTVEFCYGYLASEMSIFTPSELITDAGQCSVAIGCYKSNHHYNSQSADGAIAKSIFFCQGRKNLTKITIASCEKFLLRKASCISPWEWLRVHKWQIFFLAESFPKTLLEAYWNTDSLHVRQIVDSYFYRTRFCQSTFQQLVQISSR